MKKITYKIIAIIIIMINLFVISSTFPIQVKAISYSIASEYDNIGSYYISDCVAFAKYKVPSLPDGLKYLEDKKRIINSQIAVAGAIAITAGDTSYGHVCYVESVDGTQISTLHGGFNGYVGNVNFTGHIVRERGTKEELGILGFWIPANLGDTLLTSDIETAFIDPTSMTDSSYKVKVKMTDNKGVDKVQVSAYIFADNYTPNDVWHTATYNSSTGYYEYTIKKSENNNITGMYSTHIQAWDKAGNKRMFVLQAIPIGTTVANNLGSFSARIALSKNTNYNIGTTGNKQNSNVVLKAKDLSDESQIWKFTKNSDGTYTIASAYSNLVLDIGGDRKDNGANVQIFPTKSTGAQNQRFYIMNYNGGYRIVPQLSGDLKALDLNNNKIEENQNIQIWEAGSFSSAAQTWKLEIIAKHLYLTGVLNRQEVKVGETIKFNADIDPSDVSSKKVLWESSDESIATISENGVLTALKAGTVKIKATTTDGSNLSAICTINVIENEDLIYTTIPTKEISSNEVMSINSKTKMNDFLTSDNFPIVDKNYAIKVYNNKNEEKDKKAENRIGSKDYIVIYNLVNEEVARYTVVVKGDVTGNGYSRMYDAFQILKDSINGKKIDEIDLLIRDYDGNGAVRMYDAFQFLKQAVLGK